jgi:DNA mismatch repair protein MutS
VHLAATEHRGRIVFLHSVKAGAASQSYGVQVARLAGVPAAVLNAARRKLESLEQQRPAETMQGDLFRAPATPPVPRHSVLDRLAEIDPDTLTPRQALDALYELHALLDRSPPPG